jgi:plasmid maintenance system killer protein
MNVMPKIRQTLKFQKQVVRLHPTIRQQLFAKLLLFEKNIRHPSLHTEKLGRGELRSFRVNQNFRVIFRFSRSHLDLHH